MKTKMSVAASVAALLALGGSALAEMPTSIGEGEGEVDIVAWPGYIERGETDKNYDWVTAFEKETGAVFVHAFEDVRTASGQGTLGLELVEQCPAPSIVLIPVGGGGLFAGVATVLKARVPSVRIVAVQPDASPAFVESVRQGRPLLTYPAGPTLADGLAGGIGEIAYDHRGLVDEHMVVSEHEIEEAMVALIARDQVVAEASGAVGVAAVRSGRVRPRASSERPAPPHS